MGDDDASDPFRDPDAPWRRGYGGPSTALVDGPSSATESADERVAPAAVDTDGVAVERRADGDRGAGARLPEPGARHRTDGQAPAAQPSPWSRAAAERTALDTAGSVRPARLDRTPRPRRVRPEPTPVASRTGARADDVPVPAVTGELVLGAVCLLAALIVAAVSVWALLTAPSTEVEAASEPMGATIPTVVDERWSQTVDGRIDAVAAGEGVVVISTPTDVVAFDGMTGGELWAQPHTYELFGPELRVYPGVVVALDGGVGPLSSAQGFDATTGELLWFEVSDRDLFTFTDDWVVQVAPRRRATTTRVLDPVTGEPATVSFTTDDIVGVGPYFVDDDDGVLELYDSMTLERVAGPVNGSGLRAITMIGERPVGFGSDNRIVAFDANGARTDERPFRSDTLGDAVGRAELIGGVPGSEVGVVASGSSIGFVVDDGQLDVVWELEGRVGPPIDTEIGPLSVARLAAEPGEVDLALVDPVSGDVVAVTDAGTTREADPHVAYNGYVVAPAVDTVRELMAFSHGGDEPLWTLSLPVQASYTVTDEAVLVVEATPGSSTLTVHG